MVGIILAQISATLGGGTLAGRVLVGLGNSSGAITIATALAMSVPSSSVGGAPGTGGTTKRCLISRNLGSSILTAWPQVTPNQVGPQNLDIVQIVDNNGDAILLNVDYTGAVHFPAVNPTNGTRLGPFMTRLSSSSALVDIMHDAFTNFDNEDIIQVINIGGNISYWWDANGVAHGS